ncbi:DUF4329 domain-containing protein [Neoroseomonas soli]|uniref:DUF4329 domain-containing protein n=1 Tax=Neoroseomonas soli TaxID=1081025 RepID=A0A9X9WZR7_9PROT|nr:DUF4329 domain-containing protein [Neoroseomonas soli]MBR0672646.1 DUF4329 domain-containing protein [Neoroseomonas soli]
MPDDGADTGQHKSTTVAFARLDETARDELAKVLPGSIKSELEKGAVLCRDDRTQQIFPTPLRTGEAKHSVDVGLREPNCGCPSGSTPLAYYHTHPSPPGEVAGSDGLMHVAEGFSDEDLDVSDQFGVVGYVGQRDGTMLAYVPKVEVVSGEGYRAVVQPTDAEGRALKIARGEIKRFNWKLPTGR